MRKLWLALALLLVFAGCAAIKESVGSAKACLSDPVCLEKATNEAKSAKAVAVSIAGVSPIPLSANLVGGGVYGIALLIALIKGGKKKEGG